MVGRITVTVLDAFGLDAAVELTFRRDVVEIRHDDHCRAVFRRDHLREWLTYPQGTYTVDEVSLILSTDGILLRIEPGIPAHPLSRVALDQLRANA